MIPDEKGQYFRQWRDHIKSPDDIWNEIVQATRLPGVTSAPKLQPIETRLIMLQTGMRAPMGVKVRGRTLADIEQIQAQPYAHFMRHGSVPDALADAAQRHAQRPPEASRSVTALEVCAAGTRSIRRRLH